MRLWVENQEKDEPNFQKDDWELFNKFVVSAGQVDDSYKKSSMMSLDMEPVTSTDEGSGNWVEHRLDATLGRNSQIIAPAMAGPPLINAAFRVDMTKMLGTSIVTLKVQQPQQQKTRSTQSVQTRRRDNYNDHVSAALMGYANVFNTSDIPRIWGKFQQSKELADKSQ